MNGGFLLDGKWMLIKIFKSSPKIEQELVSDVDILTLLKHNHIITFIGYSVESLNNLLVYNFVSRGNLDENIDCMYSIVLHLNIMKACRNIK